MINKQDLQLLGKMQRELRTRQGRASLGQLAVRLLELRDELSFEDEKWYHKLTQHIATLDSADSYLPRDVAEELQKESAIDQAVDGLLRLVADRLAH